MWITFGPYKWAAACGVVARSEFLKEHGRQPTDTELEAALQSGFRQYRWSV